MKHVSVPKLRESLSGRTTELVAAGLTATGKFVLADWLKLDLEFTIGAIVFWVAYVILRHKANPTVLKRWGFRRAGMEEASLLCAAATTLIFFRTRNLWMIGVLHGWFASLFYFLVMGHDPLEPLLLAAFG